MWLNRKDDPLAIPVKILKKANRLMKSEKATRCDIADVVASKLKRYRGYRNLERTDRVLAIRWRLEVADPSHKSHEGWQKLLSYWRGRRSRERMKQRRKEDPEYDKLCKAKKKAYRERKIKEDPNFLAKQREYGRKSELKIQKEDPERWAQLKEKKSDRSRVAYQKDRRYYIEKAKRYQQEMKQDPERYARYLIRNKSYQKTYYQRNKDKLESQRRIRRRNAK